MRGCGMVTPGDVPGRCLTRNAPALRRKGGQGGEWVRVALLDAAAGGGRRVWMDGQGEWWDAAVAGDGPEDVGSGRCVPPRGTARSCWLPAPAKRAAPDRQPEAVQFVLGHDPRVFLNGKEMSSAPLLQRVVHCAAVYQKHDAGLAPMSQKTAHVGSSSQIFLHAATLATSMISVGLLAAVAVPQVTPGSQPGRVVQL
ncbi:hypothetical protein DFJ74DRAFT_670529 [Hyaloraphidium curvatum]|nr:hypothetical protein DFJ74DRAFT_670529 [Hyaloraphidium curvatum]